MKHLRTGFLLLLATMLALNGYALVRRVTPLEDKQKYLESVDVFLEQEIYNDPLYEVNFRKLSDPFTEKKVRGRVVRPKVKKEIEEVKLVEPVKKEIPPEEILKYAARNIKASGIVSSGGKFFLMVGGHVYPEGAKITWTVNQEVVTITVSDINSREYVLNYRGVSIPQQLKQGRSPSGTSSKKKAN